MRSRVIAAAMVAGVIAVYALRLDDLAGVYTDDAYYVVLAQSVARGDGYTLGSSAIGPILPGFPPGLALLLAPVIALSPKYPDNLVWLRLVSIAAMLGVGLLTYLYFHRYRTMARARAAIIALLTVLTPGFVFLATSTVMSECVFTLALLGSACAIERASLARDSSWAPRDVLIAALTTTAAWMIRAAGIALVPAGALFLARTRGWRAASVFVIACGIFYAPWLLYSAAHAPAMTERIAHGGDIVRGYGPPRPTGVVERAAANTMNVFGRNLGAMVFPAGYRGADESGLEVFNLRGARGFRAGSMGVGAPVVAMSMVAALFALAGAVRMARRRVGVAEWYCVVTIAMLVIGTSEAVFRYVLPLAPFVIAYFLAGVEWSVMRLRAEAGPPAFRVAAGCLVALLAAEHGRYVWLKMQGPAPSFVRDAREVREVIDYIDTQLPNGAVVASTNPGLVYLLTGRKGVAYVDPLGNAARWRAAGIDYAAALHMTPRPARLPVLFESPRLKLWVARLAAGSSTDRN